MAPPATRLDDEALALFARKGLEAGVGAPQVGEGNAVKVRRVVQLTADLAGPLEGLRILDLGCGDGVYAIEAGLAGAEVLGIDARDERMGGGEACARRHGLDRVTFRQGDVREVRREADGTFDVVWCLGLLYHLDVPDLFCLLRRLRELCGRLLVVDTLIAPEAETEVEHAGRRYGGRRVREHADDDPPEVRRARLLRSIDNPLAFLLTREALVRALGDAGFTSVLECWSPPEPGKAADRVTFAALSGAPARVETYPWINGLDDDAIARRLGAAPGPG